MSKIRCEPKILNLNVIEEMKKFSVILLLIIVPFLLDAQDTIKKNGIYDEIKALLADANKEVVELSGIMPNPTYNKVQEGAKLF